MVQADGFGSWLAASWRVIDINLRLAAEDSQELRWYRELYETSGPVPPDELRETMQVARWAAALAGWRAIRRMRHLVVASGCPATLE